MRDLINQTLCFAKGSAKAIAGFAAAAVVGYAARVGLDVGPEVETGLAALGVALIIWFAPKNRPCE